MIRFALVLAYMVGSAWITSKSKLCALLYPDRRGILQFHFGSSLLYTVEISLEYRKGLFLGEMLFIFPLLFCRQHSVLLSFI